MRVTIEQVTGGQQLAHCNHVGCHGSTEARGEWVVMPMYEVTIDTGPDGRSGYTFMTCEEHLREFQQDVAFGVALQLGY